MIEQNAATLIIESWGTKASMEENYDLGRMKAYGSDKRHYEAVRRKARELLFREGIDDISAEMDAMGRAAWNAYRDLNWSVIRQSRPVAELMARHGYPEMQARQQLRDAPPAVRYAREIEFDNQNTAWHRASAEMVERTKGLSQGEIDLIVALHRDQTSDSQ